MRISRHGGSIIYFNVALSYRNAFNCIALKIVRECVMVSQTLELCSGSRALEEICRDFGFRSDGREVSVLSNYLLKIEDTFHRLSFTNPGISFTASEFSKSLLGNIFKNIRSFS